VTEFGTTSLKIAGDEAELSEAAASEISHQPTGVSPVRLRDPPFLHGIGTA
jgi:hypothetical protein